MKRPRLIYYNDAHHFHGKRMEPPASIHMLEWPVNEIAGTGVDLLAIGLGYADVYFHQSKVGRVVGQQKEVWENYIDWRIMRMVEEAAEKGTDQLREVIRRGRETGIRVFPSIKLQDGSVRYGERCGSLKWERGKEVCIAEEGKNEWAYDYANKDVREYKLAMIREVLEDYEADGIELDYKFGGAYFKSSEGDNGTSIMNAFVAEVKELATQIGQKQGREIGVMARADLLRDVNLSMNLDVEQWLKDGLLDYVVGQDPYVVSETNVDQAWLPDAANANNAAAYYRPPRRVYDERVGLPSIEMYRALNQSLISAGWTGQYHGYLLWPFADREYQMLRELAHPEVHVRSPKRYLVQPREGVLGEPTTTPHRQVPVDLVEGETAKVNLSIADDIDSAKADGEMRKPILTIRFSYFCIEDEYEIRFNGETLPLDEFEITDERGLEMRVRLAGSMSVQAPAGMSAHWFRSKLPIDLVRRGDNLVEVEMKKFEPRAGFTRSINGVEVLMRYKDMQRPEGFDVERMAPLSA
jgi:hypothetical protein